MKLFSQSLSSNALLATTLAVTLCVGWAVAEPPQDNNHALIAKKVAKTTLKKSTRHYTKTTSIDLLKNPSHFLNKSVEFEGTFNSFSSLGLNYKKAYKDPKDFISILILRPDVTHHKVPLSELKLMYPRKKSEAILKLESGDIIKIKGKVFSTMLNDPWVEIDAVDILKKMHPKPKEDPKQECC